MAALHVRPSMEDGAVVEGEELERSGGGQEEGGTEASSPTGSTTDEDTDEDSEAEPPSVVCRKVSFADAFGLNLVSVKEFDNVEATVSEVSRPPEREAASPLEEFYMSCLFTVPSSPEELAQRLQAQMVELESIELLPGTSMLRGIVRVVNLGYSKSVYARISLDCWSSYFDLFAEYVPGSSDRETDRFAFKYTLTPPFDREGTRVDFCLCYETTAGTFWANNKELNYVLFCHQRGPAREPGPQVMEERSKRSCLKANRRGGAEEKTKESNGTAALPAGAHDRQAADGTEAPSPSPREGHQPPVDGIKRWPCLTRGQDHPSQRRQAPRVYSHDSAGAQKISPLAPAPWCDPVSSRYNRQKRPSDGPRILTYHQIPLLTLDWKSDTPQRWGPADMDDIWAGGGKLTRPRAAGESAEDTPSVSDLWERFLNRADEDTSACDVWREFLNQPSRRGHAGVPEAEWLQTAATLDASRRSQTNSVTHTPQEFSQEGAGPAAGGCVTLHMADLVTSSGETKTADVGETPRSQNANAGDSISQRAGLDEGLEGAAHNAASDTLAFGETIGQRTEDGETIFRPQETEASGNPPLETERDENERPSEMTEGKESSSSITVKEIVDAPRQPATTEGAEESTRRGLTGDVEDPRLERRNASGESKEREKVENPPRVECRKSPAEVAALEARAEEAFIERFGEELVRGIWEEVFGQGTWDMNMKGREAAETSGVEPPPGSRQLINHATDLDSSARPAREIWTESSQNIGSAKEQENASQTRNRSRQEAGGQTEDFNRPAQRYHKHATFPPGKLKESGEFVRWSLHVLRHLTRLLLCILLVGGFFTILFIYDFPAFIALYVFSGGWWFYKWTRHHVAMDKRARGEEASEGGEECGV